MLQDKPTIEIIVPVFNEEQCLDTLVSRLLALRRKMNGQDVSFIFVDDGSKDGSLRLLERYAALHPFVKVISFSRNFGHQMAVTAGLDHADADYVAIIDADLQDPPELIEDMFKKAEEGFDVVYGKRLERNGETWFKKITAKLFYVFIRKMCDVDIPSDAGDFRLITRQVVLALREMKERHRFIRGMVPWVGFASTPLLYNRDRRFAGETKYPFKKMFRFAKDAIFSFSSTPLKVANFVGSFIVGIGILGALLMVYLRLMTSYTVPGITAVLLAVIVLGGIQIIMIGMIGEYIGRIFEEVKNRPLYIIKAAKNIKK